MMKNTLDFLNKDLTIKLYAAVLVISIICVVFAVAVFDRKDPEKADEMENMMTDKIAALEKRLKASKAEIDRLNRQLARLEKNLSTPLSASDLKIKDIEDPIGYLRKDLMSRPDLIRYQGVLGGTMGFHDENNIHVLNHRWVYAKFDDGHIAGEMLLEYAISENGKIKWSVIDSFL